MGSIEENVVGEYFHAVICPDTENGDPWKRNYFAPPQHLELATRKYPLIDVRPLLEQKDYSPAKLLQSHGFGVVKHQSQFLEQMQDGEIPESAVADTYYPEIEELVNKTTGAKKVFVMASALRQGKRAPSEYKSATGLKSVSEAVNLSQTADQSQKTPPQHKLAKQSKIVLAAPVRKPHMDYTPLGARQDIRCKSVDIYEAAKESGVIDYEDEICWKKSVRAPTAEANAAISESYNAGGALGPRYAAFSIWRPLKKVERDPLTLSPRRETRTAPGEGVYWPYENRIPGPAELHGDYLKEYAMLGVKSKEPAPDRNTEDKSMKWYYVKGQDADEVLFIKLFDSAALGEDSEHASAPWHASPEIGSVAGEEPRESIDVRVLVFW